MGRRKWESGAIAGGSVKLTEWPVECRQQLLDFPCWRKVVIELGQGEPGESEWTKATGKKVACFKTDRQH